MYTRNIRFWLLFLTCFLSLAGYAQKDSMQVQSNGQTLLWRISGKNIKNFSYLFGTFHLLCKNDIHITKPMKRAIRKVDEVYFELDMDDPKVFLDGMKYMKMDSGQDLSKLMSAEKYQQLESFFRDSLKMSLSFFKTLKPIFLEGLFYTKFSNCNAQSGMEAALMQEAQSCKKPINGLETMALQAGVFNKMPLKEQADALIKSMDSLIVFKAFFNKMVDYYVAQDLKQLNNFLNNPAFGMGENQEELLDIRNKNWLKQLQELMPKKSMFVAVGAGHLLGELGLIKLLQNAGYTVEPIENLDQSN